MGQLLEFKPLKAVSSIFDGWTKQCFGELTDYAGGSCVWGFLIRKYGMRARDTKYLTELVGPFAEWLRKELDLPAEWSYHSIKRSLTFVYGPETFPLNILIYANDELKWTPDDFRTAELSFQFEVEQQKLPKMGEEGNEFNSKS